MNLKHVQLATGLLLNEQGDVLFLQRSPNSKHWPLEWQFPEGKIEPNESSEQAVAREVREETGITVRKVDFLGQREVQMEWKYENVLAHRDVFRVEWEGTIRLSEEHCQYTWINLAKPHISYYKGTLEIIELLSSRNQ